MSEHDKYRNERYLEAPLDRALFPYADEIVRLAVELRELDLIDGENVGKLKSNTAWGVWAIEADHPDGGPWLYGRDGVSPDGIEATRMRAEGRYEHSVLVEYGRPIKWRTVARPDLN